MSLENTNSTIQRVVAVMSNKGGTGKSTITGLLAVALHRRGMRVGILDGDLDGPSIVHIFGATGEFSLTDDGQTAPLRSKNALPLMGINVFLEDQTDPITWRGPMMSSAFRQFYSDVAWGDLDVLLVDVPTGTADVPLTVLEFLPLTGVVIVTTPQVLASALVTKCVKMVRQFNGNLIGVVENMAYLAQPELADDAIFGRARSSDISGLADVPLLGRVPFDPALRALCDAGEIEQYDTAIVSELAANLLAALDTKTLARR